MTSQAVKDNDRRFYAEQKNFQGVYVPALFFGDPPGVTATGTKIAVRNVHELLCAKSLQCSVDELHKHFNDIERLDILSRKV